MEGRPQQSETQPDALRSHLSKRTKVITAAHSPLGFCVLALLIVEAFLTGAGIMFGLSEIYKIAALGVGVVLFVLVFFTVVWLVVKHPQKLVFGEESHINYALMQQRFGSDQQSVSAENLIQMIPTAPPSTANQPAAELPPPAPAVPRDQPEGNQ